MTFEQPLQYCYTQHDLQIVKYQTIPLLSWYC